MVLSIPVIGTGIWLSTKQDNEGSGHGHIVPNRAYREYTLGDYSGWLRHRVHAWNRIRNCLASSTTCATLTQRYPLAQDFFNAHLTPIESGCCKPPTLCGYTFVSATYWISPINIGEDMDCLTWNNDQTQLCYSCNSCKAGLLANLKKEWRVADVLDATPSAELRPRISLTSTSKAIHRHLSDPFEKGYSVNSYHISPRELANCH
ncbi:hypothetical protein SUGI_1154380 [Cryptomeria japonica]|nr:hypothetical protein SUGI_1154380 [Cryptomeria japonica]